METIGLILLGIAGILIHILFKFYDLVTKTPKKAKGFDGLAMRFAEAWGNFDLLGSLVYSILAFIIVLVFVFIRDELVNIFPVTKISIIFYGYAADSAFNNLKPEKLKT